MKKKTVVSLTLSALATTAVLALLLGNNPAVAATELGAPGLVASNFKDGALTDPIAEEACTLTNGDETTCYRVTVTGTPVDTTIGPFCPTTTSTSAADAGIWLDGSKIYDVDGAFILDLSEIYGDAKWKLYDDSGNVNVTDTKEAFQGAARPDVQEEYKYHCVEGKYEWTNTGEAVPISMLVPKEPVKADSASSTRGVDLGVTTNGVVIAASAPVDAILGAYTIAAFDDCGAHFNPGEGYHMHAYTNCEGASYGSAISDVNAETKLIGYALDGVAIFAPLASNTSIELDECNGRTTEADGYHYYAQSPEKNLVVKCLMGVTAVDDTKPTGFGPPPGALTTGSPTTDVILLVGGVAVLVSGLSLVAILVVRKRKKKAKAD